MASIVYVTAQAPALMTDHLISAGHRVWECLSISEVLYICEQEWIDAIVIAPTVQDPEILSARFGQITLRLQPEVTAQELIWELSNLFGKPPSRTQ